MLQDRMILPDLRGRLNDLQKTLHSELCNILHWWEENMINEQGKFYGSVDATGNPVETAPVGIVMVSRILWTFSAACNAGLWKNPDMAHQAWENIRTGFADHVYGGVYWSVDAAGNPLETRKQIYGQAFCVYGLAEYYKLTGDEEVIRFARDIFTQIENHSYDPADGGYIEAFDRRWHPLDDVRLSAKDANEEKTMNTHLHLLEAYTNLWEAEPSQQYSKKIIHLLDLFDEKIIDPDTGHMHLFFDKKWMVQSESWSYGHDIEASWLLLESADSLHDRWYSRRFKRQAIQLANAALEGLDTDGALFSEINYTTQHLNKEKHWWPQAEAMVGYLNAWEISGDNSWIEKLFAAWGWIEKNLKDQKNGEWHWGIDEAGNQMQEEKAGFWKCPYHNGRACLELIKRIQKILESQED